MTESERQYFKKTIETQPITEKDIARLNNIRRKANNAWRTFTGPDITCLTRVIMQLEVLLHERQDSGNRP